MNTTTPIKERVVNTVKPWRVVDSKGKLLDTFDKQKGAEAYAVANGGKVERV